jgi:2-oxoglutarate/2-oxoacid ferredoxin oxidoreductase subunit alpha
MSQPQPGMAETKEKEIVNDFSITFSTVNGSGSATANLTMMRAIFLMGVPVSGKNIFPSNIQGLPTWFTLRVNKNGFLARDDKQEIVVAMNASTFAQELESVASGGVLFYSDSIIEPINRTDIFAYPMPIQEILKIRDFPKNLKSYMANMVYVGIVAQMIGIDLDKIRQALTVHFKDNQKALDSNFDMIKSAADWAKENIVKKDPFRLEPMDLTKDFIMGNGNEAAALGSIYGGLQFTSWYPITPATGIAESLNDYLPRLRRDPETGKDTYVVIQAEDELAAIGMIVGAGWAGLRSMTCTSGPGLSLMAEFLGLAYYVEVPLVVWDVQRVGPSTGLPTRTSQSDITFANFISHGDTKFIMLFPSSLKECFEFGWKSFDLAERLQTPVLVLIDLDLGMNHWMSEKFEYPDAPMDRGKILWEEDLEKLLQKRNGDWGRYLDIDGDGIPYRTVAGNKHPKSAWFARGTGHDEYTRYTEKPADWEKGMERLMKKFETAKSILPKNIEKTMEGAKVGIISCGTTDLAVEEARYYLAQKGIRTDYLRVRATPFTEDVDRFIQQHERIYVVELNTEGQLKQLLTLEVTQCAGNLRQVSKNDGLPMTAKFIIDAISLQEVKK